MEIKTFERKPTRHFIISTSNRPSSVKRYNILLHDILHLEIDYRPILPLEGNNNHITPEQFASELKKPGAIGGAISKDIKSKIIPLLDVLNPMASKAYSVNTVVCYPDNLVGYNTDAFGLSTALEKGIVESGIDVRTAVVYGYGGVFNTAYTVLKEFGIKTYVTGRRTEEIERTEKEFKLEKYDGKPKDLFINATPVTDSPLVDAKGFLDALQGCKMVFDHNMPGEKLAKYCRENNIFYIPGTKMYYPQMEKQWELFLHDIVDPKKIPELLAQAEELANKQN